MADVNRGQLILITGMVIAISFITLTLLLNTAIYTENLASRGTDVGDRDALEFRETAIESAQTLLEEENELEYDSHAQVESNVTDGLDTYARIQSLRYAENGAIADVSDLQVHGGTTLRQTDSSRNMTDGSDGSLDWTVASDVHDARNFTMTFSDVNETTDPENEAFHVTVTATDDWRLYAYENNSENHLAVKNGTDPIATEICGGPFSTPFTVNLTAGTVDGTACSAIDFAKGVDAPYTIEYAWGNRSFGTYELTVNSTTTAGTLPPGSSTAPYRVPMVYSVSFDVTYHTGQLRYRDRVAVLPGETP